MNLDPHEIGRRLRELRESCELSTFDAGTTHHHIWKIEHGLGVSVGRMDALCRRFGVSISRLWMPDGDFERMLTVEDNFVRQVLPFLKQLNAKQKEFVLKTLDAAPKILSAKQHKYARIRKATSIASRNSTGSKVSPTTSQTSPIRSLPSVRSPMMDGFRRELF